MTSEETQAADKKKAQNPFPSSAVARLTAGESGYLTLRTRAVEESLDTVADYLERSQVSDKKLAKRGASGAAVAVIGEYGTGKTHIAREILQQVWKSGSSDLHAFYLDAPADTFLSLYRDRFVPKLRRDQVRERVQEFYADIVADHLEGSKPHKELVAALRDRTADPILVERDLGLPKSQLERELIKRLKVVTERDDFGTALALFLDPDFEDPVWEWLRGLGLDDGLRECGVTDFVGTDARALEAIGVMAFLFGRQKHRFVLVIDEMEKVLSHESHTAASEETVLAFKKLLEVCGQMRALVILCGLPDFFEILPDDARQRFNPVVRPGGLSAAEIAEYVKKSQQRVLGRQRLKPFTSEILSYVAQLTGGNARKVIRLLFHIWQDAQKRGIVVNRAMVREVARDQFEVSSADDVDAALVRVFDRNGWLFEKQFQLGEEADSKVDFWLPIGQEGAGCAILMSRSILTAKESKDVAKLGKTLAAGAKDEAPRKILLVVNGYVSSELEEELKGGVERAVVFNARSFSEDAEAALKGLRKRIEETAREDAMQTLKEQVLSLTRQNRQILREIEVGSRRSITTRQVSVAVASGIRKAFSSFGEFATDRPVIAPISLVRTRQVFEEVLIILKRYRSRPSLEDEWGFMATLHGRRAPDEDEENEFQLAIERATGMVASFQDSVYLLAEESPGLPVGDIVDLCRRFDTLVRDRHIARDLAKWIDRRRLDDPDRVRYTLERLGERVYDAFNSDMSSLR